MRQGFDVAVDETNWSVDQAVGRTLPAAYLHELWAGPHRLLQKVLRDVEEVSMLLDTRWDVCFGDPAEVPPKPAEQLPEKEREVRTIVMHYLAWQARTNRNIQRLDTLDDDGELSPYLGAGHWWSSSSHGRQRDGVATRLLGRSPRSVPGGFTATPGRPHDRAIGIVSLLLSDLDGVPAKELRDVGALIARERKAIALARQRRTKAWMAHATYPRELVGPRGSSPKR